MQYIKKDSSGKVVFGPIVKSTDGYSALTGVGTAAATGAIVFVYGTSSTADMTTAHSWEEIADGLYLVGLSSNVIGTTIVACTSSSSSASVMFIVSESMSITIIAEFTLNSV